MYTLKDERIIDMIYFRYNEELKERLKGKENNGIRRVKNIWYGMLVIYLFYIIGYILFGLSRIEGGIYSCVFNYPVLIIILVIAGIVNHVFMEKTCSDDYINLKHDALCSVLDKDSREEIMEGINKVVNKKQSLRIPSDSINLIISAVISAISFAAITIKEVVAFYGKGSTDANALIELAISLGKLFILSFSMFALIFIMLVACVALLKRVMIELNFGIPNKAAELSVAYEGKRIIK